MTGVDELPVLDATRCTGCGDCEAVCPTACLEMAGTTPWLPRPRDCIACTVCAFACPANAIAMAELVAATNSDRHPNSRR